MNGLKFRSLSLTGRKRFGNKKLLCRRRKDKMASSGDCLVGFVALNPIGTLYHRPGEKKMQI